ncbi:MAG TPA: RNA polymerase sigma factor, partial [Blastocatellia bacterium]|nr:RNA polymerase sigma factor [Blastocatellia bacterium]
YQKLIRQIVRRYFRTEDEIEELTQIISIEAWFEIGNFREQRPQSFAAWLSRIATNTCFDELRRRRRCRENTFSQLSDAETQMLMQQPDGHFTGQGIEDKLIRRDLMERLMTALEPDDRQLFVKLKSEESSVAELAQATGWTQSKVKMRIYNSRLMLRRKLKRLV